MRAAIHPAKASRQAELTTATGANAGPLATATGAATGAVTGAATRATGPVTGPVTGLVTGLVTGFATGTATGGTAGSGAGNGAATGTGSGTTSGTAAGAATSSTAIIATGSTARRHGNSNAVAASACSAAVQPQAASHRPRRADAPPANRPRVSNMLPGSIAPLCRRPPHDAKPQRLPPPPATLS